MVKLWIGVILSFILIICNFVFIIKNFFIEYKGSRKTYKNLIVIILMVIAITMAGSCVVEGKRGIDITRALKNPESFSLTEKKIKIFKSDLGVISRRTPIWTGIGYILSILAYLQYRNIQKEKEEETLKEDESWDISKFKNE